MEHRRPPVLRTAVLCAVLPLAGCDLLNTPGGEPEEVTVQVQSSDVGDAQVVTSTSFLLVPDPECPEECPETVSLVSADTAASALPFDRTYRFTRQLQFFVEAFHTSDQPATLTMRVIIDGRVWYDDFRTLNPTEPGEERETIRFVYRYSEGGIL